VACLLILTITTLSAREKKKDSTEKENAKPLPVALILKVSPRHGFRPLSVTLYARLQGVAEGTDRFCHAGIEWIGQNRGNRVMRSTEDARCLHPKAETRVEHSWTKTLSLGTPGIFRYQVTLHLKSGEKIMSNTVDVRILGNR
jgi:hypothetical protein